MNEQQRHTGTEQPSALASPPVTTARLTQLSGLGLTRNNPSSANGLAQVGMVLKEVGLKSGLLAPH